jgi:hypothetical protein
VHSGIEKQSCSNPKQRHPEKKNYYTYNFSIKMSLEEDNGLFGFDFDDEDFVTKEKEKVSIAQVEYEAKVETDGVIHFDGQLDLTGIDICTLVVS